MSRSFISEAEGPLGDTGFAVASRSVVPSSSASSWAKRLLDVVGSLLLIVFLAPLLILVAILVRTESAGPALFKQRRTGLGGQAFFIYKFRTMFCCEDGPNVVQAIAGDQRVTRIGSFLRKTSIDELPQLFNVLKGEMSLVGPRPHAVAHDEFYSDLIPGYRRRFAAKPGITGWAQVRGLRGETRTVGCMAARIQADVEYVTTWSFWIDLRIIARSVAIVFTAGGQ